MIITLKEGLSVPYRFKFFKRCIYKEKKLAEVKSNGEFLLSMNNTDGLELQFKNKSYLTSTTKDPLIFSPVKLNYNTESNVFFIKNKEHLKMQWDKHKEKYRNSKNLSVILVIERLYFHVLLGLEYDLLSSGSYIPFFSDLYNQEINEDTVLRGMNWVSNPLSIPVKVSYELSKYRDNIIFLTGLVSLDEENLTKLIADKNFQKQAKSYHYTRNFTITSDIKVAYDLETGYLLSSEFLIKVKGEEEGIDEEVSFEVSQLENEKMRKSSANISFLV
jgi:hypothetical protein